MATPSGRLTRGTILQLAQRQAGNTNTQLVAEMRVWLNLVLQDLYSQWDWPFLFTSASYTLSGTTFTLPTNFLKSQDEWGLKITAQGGVVANIRVPEVSEETFDARAISDATGGIPLMWHPDREAGVGRIWPTPTDTISATLRYKIWVADADVTDTETYDDDIPTFPFHSYLVERMTAQVFKWDRNWQAYDRTTMAAEIMFERQRGTALPRYSISDETLDPSTFGPSFIPEDA